MSEVLLAGLLHRETEFTNGLTGACGPNAAHTCVSWASGVYVSTYAVYRSMYAHVPALCSSNGVSNIGGLNAAMPVMGYSVGAYQPYAGDYWTAWRSFVIHELNAGRIVLIEISRGQNLKNYLNGHGENAVNLQYHFIAIVGYNTGGPSMRPEAAGKILPNGWWVADGDNWDSGNILQFYQDSVLNSASPCCGLSVNHKGSAGQVINYSGGAVPSSNGNIMIPVSWNDNGVTLAAPNGESVGHGFRYHIESQSSWPAALVPVSAEYSIGGEVRQDFALTLAWRNNAAVEIDGPLFHADLDALNAKIIALTAQLSDVQSKLTQSESQVQTLTSELQTASQQNTTLTDELQAANQEITALKNQPAPTPTVNPLTPDAEAALAYVKALKQAEAADAAATQAKAAAFSALQ